MTALPVVLTIAGFDPSSGAGITADVKTLAAHGCYAVACITAVTVQSTRGVKRVVPLAPTLVRETLYELADDFEIGAVKIGMLGSAAVARAVLSFLHEKHPKNVVLDPVLRSSSGAALVEERGAAVLRKMLSVADIVTPNVQEASVLAGIPIRKLRVHIAAKRLHELGARNMIITGGDLEARHGQAIDLASFNHGSVVQELAARKIKSRSTHGTGCAFASAIAANLALGVALPQAVAQAKEYVLQAIRTAPGLGHGYGPLNHFAVRNRRS